MKTVAVEYGRYTRDGRREVWWLVEHPRYNYLWKHVGYVMPEVAASPRHYVIERGREVRNALRNGVGTDE